MSPEAYGALSIARRYRPKVNWYQQKPATKKFQRLSSRANRLGVSYAEQEEYWEGFDFAYRRSAPIQLTPMQLEGYQHGLRIAQRSKDF